MEQDQVLKASLLHDYELKSMLHSSSCSSVLSWTSGFAGLDNLSLRTFCSSLQKSFFKVIYVHNRGRWKNEGRAQGGVRALGKSQITMVLLCSVWRSPSITAAACCCLSPSFWPTHFPSWVVRTVGVGSNTSDDCGKESYCKRMKNDCFTSQKAALQTDPSDLCFLGTNS